MVTVREAVAVVTYLFDGNNDGSNDYYCDEISIVSPVTVVKVLTICVVRYFIMVVKRNALTIQAA